MSDDEVPEDRSIATDEGLVRCAEQMTMAETLAMALRASAVAQQIDAMMEGRRSAEIRMMVSVRAPWQIRVEVGDIGFFNVDGFRSRVQAQLFVKVHEEHARQAGHLVPETGLTSSKSVH